MSVLWKISTNDRLFIKNGFQSICAYYSRLSKSTEAKHFFKFLTEKLTAKEENDTTEEGGPNWELFNPKGNRFYLPNSVGLAWQHPKTVGLNVELEELVDFKSTKWTDKFCFSSQPCPKLIRMKIEEIFPIVETMITLSYQRDTEVEYAARNFVVAAGEICRRLRSNGYWADFWNPFSGKPFYANKQKIELIDNGVYQFGIKYENLNNCMVMASDDGKNFSGSLFTDAEYNPNEMKRMIQIIRLKELLSMFDGLNNKAKF